MNTRHCCQTTREGRVNAPGRQSRWGRGFGIAGWIIPSVTLVLLPKCPACLGAYLALFTGISISVSSACNLRTSLLTLSVAALLCLALKSLSRRALRMGAFNPASPIFRHPITGIKHKPPTSNERTGLK